MYSSIHSKILISVEALGTLPGTGDGAMKKTKLLFLQDREMINLETKIYTSYEENDSRCQKELSSGKGYTLGRAMKKSSGDI